MKNLLKIIFIGLCFFTMEDAFSQQTAVYPTNWWIGMKWNKVQLLVYNKEKSIKKSDISITYPGVSISKISKLDNERYLAIDLVIAANAKPGIVPIVFNHMGTKETINWPLNQRRKGNGISYAKGVHSEDLVYLLIPDRFSNADENNDRIPGLKDQSLDRDSMYLRHGGDLQGVESKIDYLKDLGVTTIWMTPVLLNDMPNRTEHGYAITNHYMVDERIGGSKAYKKLSDELHKKDMKLIQDAVYNHIGIEHFTVKDKPMKDWLHEWPNFTQTSYKEQTIFDQYAAPSQTKKMVDGWFVRDMPDVNQNNPVVANFLIQHALWSTEEFGIDGWRIDTYTYNDMKFMNRCNKALMDDFPKLTMFGETWVHGVPNQSYFCENNVDTKVKSNLPNTTDFQTLFYGIQPALNEKFGWTEGVNKLYNTTAQDFLYKNPQGQVIFLGNHDLPRFFSVLNEDVAKYKMALGWLLTFRGIPQLYYGDEILMTGFSNPDGLVRLDFKGGWKNDSINKFTEKGRTEKENEIFNYLRKVANFRKKSSALKNGKLTQYTPDNGLYTYFRYDGKETVICMMNTADEEKEVDVLKNYLDAAKGFTKMKNIETDEIVDLKLKIGAKKMIIAKLY